MSVELALKNPETQIGYDCLMQLRQGISDTQQHRELAKWIVLDCENAGVELFSVRNPDSLYNKRWLRQIATFALFSACAKSLKGRAEESPWETISDLIFNDFDHWRCSICLTARRIHRDVQSRTTEFLRSVLGKMEALPLGRRDSELAQRIGLFESCQQLPERTRAALARATLVYSEAIKVKEGNKQHSAVAMWVMECFKIEGVTSVIIKDLAALLKGFNPDSKYIDFFSRYMEKYPKRPPLGLIFENVGHRDCDFCTIAKKAWGDARQALKALLCLSFYRTGKDPI